MPSVPDCSIDDYCQQISSLSAEAILAASSEDYESSEQILIKRLSLLKELANVVDTHSDDDALYQQYQTFLSHLQKDDEKQLAVLLKERISVAAENANQQKISKALNVYGQVKRG